MDPSILGYVIEYCIFLVAGSSQFLRHSDGCTGYREGGDKPKNPLFNLDLLLVDVIENNLISVEISSWTS